MLVLLGIVAALYERERSGLGQVSTPRWSTASASCPRLACSARSPTNNHSTQPHKPHNPLSTFRGNLTLGDVRNELRYVSAWLDQELTILEGAE